MIRSDDLTRVQARALNILKPVLGYLNRLKKRMAYRGFTQDDEMFQRAKSEIPTHELHVANPLSGVGLQWTEKVRNHKPDESKLES